MDVNKLSDNNLCGYSIGHGKANGTFGELLQGILPNKRQFMVTFPASLFSYVTFVPSINHIEVKSFPEHKTKSVTLAKSIINYFKAPVGGELFINSEIPEGKGLASSSADLVATAHAVANALRVIIKKEFIAKLIKEIEPSDGVMYPQIVSFYHRELKLKNRIGNICSLEIIAIDEGYMIDTLEYNEKVKFYTPSCALKYQKMLHQMTIAIKSHNLSEVGKISTESALMNQDNNPKFFLQDFISICNKVNGLGIVVAHSGLFIGILLNPQADNFNFQKLTCINMLKKINDNVQVFSSIDFSLNTSLLSSSAFINTEESICL